MSSSWESRLLQATALTFEELGFVLPSAEVSDQQRSAPWAAAVEIRFDGPLVGRLVLAVAGDILPTLVANMLGDEHACSVEAQHDALGELGNVICGNVLPAVAGAAATFSLQPPQLIDPMQAAATGRAACGAGAPTSGANPAAGVGSGMGALAGGSAEIQVGLGPGRAEVFFTACEAAGEQPGRRAA